jgi:DNA-binding transcriptional MerR regulator
MGAKLYKGAEICERAQIQPYVLRSWEKEFQGIGVQKNADGPRVYRESDLEQVLRIKQLVFGEGFTLAGARRQLEGTPLAAASPVAVADAETIEIFDGDAKRRVGVVREGLRAILTMLEARPSPFSLAGSGGVATSTPVRERSGAQRGVAEHSKKQVTVKPVAVRRAVVKDKRAST